MGHYSPVYPAIQNDRKEREYKPSGVDWLSARELWNGRFEMEPSRVTEDRPQILVVEDNPADVQLLRWALERADLHCDLTVINDGSAAVDYVQQRGQYADAAVPSLALLDLNLPKYDGIEILQALRASPAFADVPVAILSSSSSPREREKLDAFGVARYITKPADLEHFLAIGFVLRDLLQGTLAS